MRVLGWKQTELHRQEFHFVSPYDRDVLGRDVLGVHGDT